MRFQNQVALVTGAGSGLGRAVALGLAAEGARVVAAGRRRDRIEQTAALAQELAGGIVALELDVTVSVDLADLLREIAIVHGPIDLLVNNAGIFPPKAAVPETSITAWDSTFATNVRGPFLLLREILPGMKERNFGRVVNVSAPLKHLPHASAYCASKCALDSLTKAVAFELRGSNVLINAVEPPLLDTEMHSGGRDPVSVLPPILELLALPEGSPTGRLVKIE